MGKGQAPLANGSAMGFLIGLLVIFIIFMVAGWGWRKGRSGV